jgi:hypothetical protein
MHGDPRVCVCCESRADHVHRSIEVRPVLVGSNALVGPPTHHYRVDRLYEGREACVPGGGAAAGQPLDVAVRPRDAPVDAQPEEDGGAKGLL